MPVPNHRPDCQTRIWPTYCLDCGKRVYYFSCSCGSKVFFDSKGWPWPEHHDSCPAYMIRVMVADGSNPADLRKLLESEARSRGGIMPSHIAKMLDGYEEDTRSNKPIIHEVLPGEDHCEIEGTVIRLQAVNFYHYFHLPSNAVYRTILNDLVDEPYSEVVVRENPMKGNRVLQQYTFYIPRREITDPLLRTGIRLYARLVARVIQLDEEQAIWIATGIDWD